MRCAYILFFFFFNDTATTEIYTLSLHDALPICEQAMFRSQEGAEDSADDGARAIVERNVTDRDVVIGIAAGGTTPFVDRKSTRLNSSHANISYAVFCLKKKKINKIKISNLLYVD